MKVNRLRRFAVGFSLVWVVLLAGFAAANAFIPAWGSTLAEQSLVLPGDEIFPTPVVNWNHAITIKAAPETVWPWIAQMGDTRGGFYSYRYIEKAVTAAAGVNAAPYYQNTNQVNPAWQNPPIGQGMIMDTLVLREIKPGQYLVAGPKPEQSDGGLLWTWFLQPTPDGNTRLLVHMRVQIPGAEGNSAVRTGMNLATFMMERKMLDGIQLRAEGGAEADGVQAAEAFLWLATLALGLVAARRFMTQARWQLPLALGLASVILLLAWVYLQPALGLRLLGVLALSAALAWDSPFAQRRLPARRQLALGK